MTFLLCQYKKFPEIKNRNTVLTRNTNEMKALNMKLSKPKTYRDEIIFWLMVLPFESLQLR